MNLKKTLSTVAGILLLSVSAIAYGDDELSYDDTVDLITEKMYSSTSDARKESYGSIKFDKCRLDYNVSGTYPVGDLYNIKFSNIDFSSLNYQSSKAGHDYTSFIILNFDKPFQSRSNSKEITIRTTVVNVADDEDARTLFKAFLRLGELCGAKGKAVDPGRPPGVAPGQ